MEHLPIHLPYEARVGGPVQYRWMYPFERFLRSLKEKIKNKARVEEVEPYLDKYADFLRELQPGISDSEIDNEIASHFPLWFTEYVQNPQNQIEDPLLISLAWRPIRMVQSWPIYIVNGYKFHTKTWSEGMQTSNYEVRKMWFEEFQKIERKRKIYPYASAKLEGKEDSNEADDVLSKIADV
ncbi:hypothetical protein VNO77_41315 [Canavalia gladiata]|uniref:DUF4218 domain-containing protein n=1 Tax=Canavalia gladiata TaxID=3824 RepID=A0AAN9K107_CANGL